MVARHNKALFPWKKWTTKLLHRKWELSNYMAVAGSIHHPHKSHPPKANSHDFPFQCPVERWSVMFGFFFFSIFHFMKKKNSLNVHKFSVWEDSRKTNVTLDDQVFFSFFFFFSILIFHFMAKKKIHKHSGRGFKEN